MKTNIVDALIVARKHFLGNTSTRSLWSEAIALRLQEYGQDELAKAHPTTKLKWVDNLDYDYLRSCDVQELWIESLPFLQEDPVSHLLPPLSDHPRVKDVAQVALDSLDVLVARMTGCPDRHSASVFERCQHIYEWMTNSNPITDEAIVTALAPIMAWALCTCAAIGMDNKATL